MKRSTGLVRWGSIAWAAAGLAIALPALGQVHGEARILVGVASIGGPLAAVLAAVALTRGRGRVAGLLLLLSVTTPTYFAYPLNLPALVVGLALVRAPSSRVQAPRGRGVEARAITPLPAVTPGTP